MRKPDHRTLATCFLLIVGIAVSPGGELSLKQEYASTLTDLSRALLIRQINDPADPDAGAIRCDHCNVLHTRAGEAVFPFAAMFRITGDTAYASAAVRLGNWLIHRQEADGSWKETPEEWTGTTTDQLLMMVLAYESLDQEAGCGGSLAMESVDRTSGRLPLPRYESGVCEHQLCRDDNRLSHGCGAGCAERTVPATGASARPAYSGKDG